MLHARWERQRWGKFAVRRLDGQFTQILLSTCYAWAVITIICQGITLVAGDAVTCARYSYSRREITQHYKLKVRPLKSSFFFFCKRWTQVPSGARSLTPDHLLLDSAPNLGPLISRSLGNQQVRKLLIQKFQDFRGSKAFVSAIFEFVKFPTRYQ